MGRNIASHRPRRLAPALASTLAGALLLAGCGAGSTGAGASRAHSATAAPTAAVSSTSRLPYVGDPNASNAPDPGDATKILRVIVGLDDPPANTPLYDTNGSGAIDPGDATKVLRWVVGLDTWPRSPAPPAPPEPPKL